MPILEGSTPSSSAWLRMYFIAWAASERGTLLWALGIRYCNTAYVIPNVFIHEAMSLPSWGEREMAYPPPGHAMTAVPLGLAGLYNVSVASVVADALVSDTTFLQGRDRWTLERRRAITVLLRVYSELML